MILYYALGGGLGHVARSFALIARAPKSLLPRIRLLVSSRSAHVAEPHSPCPMDRVPERAMADRSVYARFLADYLAEHRFSHIVIDTFPFGLLGELKYIAPDLPRVLVGRYLRWEAYCERCGDAGDAAWPQAAVMIEEQDRAYLDAMERKSRVVTARWPISLAEPAAEVTPVDRPACCVVHSGPAGEIGRLVEIANRVMLERGIKGSPEIFTPGKGVFPVEAVLPRFTDVVAGAGYAACAASEVLAGRVQYHLHPFPRRFDDQALRLSRTLGGRRPDDSVGDASTVAEILWDRVIS